MRILWATDIHLDAAELETAEAFCTAVNEQAAETLLLGGDTADGPELDHWLEFLADRIEVPIRFVLGNHDYYGSSIAKTREGMLRYKNEKLSWLPAAGVVQLGERIALVGEGGWGDARLGDFDRSPIVLTDYLAIKELAQVFDLDTFDGDLSTQKALKEALMDLGTHAANSLRPALLRAVSENRHVLVLTHVPPFKESCWYQGEPTDDHWLPGFSCKAMGDLLLEAARDHPECRVTVFCGHTHGHGVADMLPNLRVHTGEARYGTAGFNAVEIENDRVAVT